MGSRGRNRGQALIGEEVSEGKGTKGKKMGRRIKGVKGRGKEEKERGTNRTPTPDFPPSHPTLPLTHRGNPSRRHPSRSIIYQINTSQHSRNPVKEPQKRTKTCQKTQRKVNLDPRKCAAKRPGRKQAKRYKHSGSVPLMA